MSSNVLPFHRKQNTGSALKIVYIAGGEYKGAEPDTYAIFAPLIGDEDFPTLSLIQWRDELRIDHASPVPNGVQIENGLLIGATILGCLFAITKTRDQVNILLEARLKMPAA